MAVTYSQSVAGEVRAEIARQRRTQAEVALQIGWTQQYLSKRLIGDIPLDTDDLEALARALRIPISQLVSPISREASA